MFAVENVMIQISLMKKKLSYCPKAIIIVLLEVIILDIYNIVKYNKYNI